MIDELKRKRITYAAIAFGVIVMLSIIGFVVFHKNNDLPPIENDSSQATDSQGTSTTIIDNANTDDPVTTSDDDIAFEHFDDLNQTALTDTRINVVEYYLGEYADTQSTGTITSFSLDTSSVKQKQDGDRTTYTFSVKDNMKKSYTVEISYIYAADAFVRIFDKDNNIIQTSPLS